MVDFKLRLHPNVLFAYSQNHVEVIVRLENRGTEPAWCEAEVKVPDGISLSPAGPLSKGRLRLGIVTKKEYLEKAVRIFANNYTAPQIYRALFTLFVFNKDGVIEKRIEKPIDIRCEIKKEEVL